MRVLVTGGAGFIGSHFVRYWLDRYPDSTVVVLDKLTYAGRRENLHDILDSIQFVHGDICLQQDVERAMHACQVVFNFAAESHVDRSIAEAGAFVHANVWGTYNLLEAATRYRVERFIQISTDEVYGSCLKGSFGEQDRLNPSSPYAASKAGADLLALSYFKTHGLPVLITRSSNNFGSHQYPEKLIPLFITNAIKNRPLAVYGDGRNIRDWIYVKDHCPAVDLVTQNGTAGEIYNIAAGNGRENLQVAHLILEFLNKPGRLIEFIQDRPGHDRRYSLDTARIEQLGWRSSTLFEDALRETIRWYQENEWWWRPLRREDKR
jgi:dTDP-glucose 4,6-dehydratase